MDRGIITAILNGDLDKNRETRLMPIGSAVTHAVLAASETWTDENTGEQQKRSEWHRMVCFNCLSEIDCEYLKKGSKIDVEGSLCTRKWQVQDRHTTETLANDRQMFDSLGSSISSNTHQPMESPSPRSTPRSC
jgi:single-strand DNA-binding protein